MSFDHTYRRYLAAITLFHQAAADASGLHGTDYQASNLLDLDGPMTSSELARRLALSHGATTRLVDRLIAAGLARRVPDPDDRRRVVIEHTGQMPQELLTILDSVRAPIADAISDLTTQQRTGVERYLEAAATAYHEAARSIHESD